MSRHGHRFFVQRSLSPGDVFALDRNQSKQIAGVLRLREGDQLGLFNGDGRAYAAVIRDSQRNAVSVEIVGSEERPRPLSPPIWLALALIKSDRFEWALQKATELGVDRVIPIETEQSVISLRVDRAERRLERWRRIIVEAAEQSGRCTVPDIVEPLALVDAISDHDACQSILLWEDETITPLTAIDLDQRPVLLMVGPEGGFSDAEVSAAKSAGVGTASLGRLTLRAETAAVAAIAMLVGQQIGHSSSVHLAEHQGRVE